MTFQPVVPFGGFAGWQFLERTVDTQRAAFNESSEIVRATEAFREKIGSIQTAADLVDNRALLSVALGAFGLSEDIDNKFFIRKVLEEGTTDTDALANKLADSSYADFSRAFGFGDPGLPRTQFNFVIDDIIDRYEARQFEEAVGEQDNDMRLALNLEPALEGLLENSSTNDGQWFSMMGNAALREMFQTGFGFPSGFANIDIDQQLEQFKARAKATFGTDQMADLADPEHQEKLIRLYLIRSEANAFAQSSGASVALTLLQQI